MQSALYVALSAQVALQNRMETVSKNLANMNTTGYRADEINFAELVSKAGDNRVSYATPGEVFISRQGGALQKTDNPLDMAVEGEGWFAIRAPEGIAYTRDGRMDLDENGVLRTVNGYEVLDAGGLPIALDPEGGPALITQSGEIFQGDDNQIGQIGLFTIPQDAKLTRFDNSAVVPDLPAEPVQVFATDGIRQGYLEGANINPIREMTKLIMITRTFESATKMMDGTGESQEKAIRELGKTS
ncbi:flagellar basal-body rod protein FlgF [Roseibium hamelinense]|uniref:Flagellar basal-body rod protein FlgF n=1 Tax=Roseibium hamelinense TaxID=150831 RepID=A0A562THT3_9HYPH|nr:flagellar basal-body rod protein FlgF [Roseibium hamelinense]MTI45892.1 flagellar basal-body rod protein FlgF [Roseibium hamelinense]TWI92923.1 flagellar basal-body rod protein FlgF [Roseibium hamelinense]